MEKHKDLYMNQTRIDQIRIERLERMALGDPLTGEKGDHEMLKEIHQILVEGNAVKKFIIKAFVATTAVAGLIYTFIKIDSERH